MEKEFYHNEFEEFIKDKADQYKMYPSDKVWKGIDRSLRSRRKWYWSGFVVLLSGISYLAIHEIVSPATRLPAQLQSAPRQSVQTGSGQLIPFTSTLNSTIPEVKVQSAVLGTREDENTPLTTSIAIPFQIFDAETPRGTSGLPASLVITGLQPLKNNEEYQIELSFPVSEDVSYLSPAAFNTQAFEGREIASTNQLKLTKLTPVISQLNSLEDLTFLNIPAQKRLKHISWQLAFSPTVNYRRLTGNGNAKGSPQVQNIPVAVQVEGDINRLVNHKPALGFELSTNAMIPITKSLTLKGGVQFNYSKYDIRAYHAPQEMATIALSGPDGVAMNSLISYTDVRNFGGSSLETLKNQYYQFSLPVGLELRLLGNDRLQLNIAGTIQPTYLINRNTYLITTDYKNYTKAPSLVRRWNMNAGAEAFISYNRGDVKWQIGPQFRYQLLSSYDKAYPIKEYLMEYGVKVGITKTIR